MRWRRGCLGRPGTAQAAVHTTVPGRASENRRELAQRWTVRADYIHTSQKCWSFFHKRKIPQNHCFCCFGDKRPLNRKISKFGFNMIHVDTDSCVHATKFGEILLGEVTKMVRGIHDKNFGSQALSDAASRSHWSNSVKTSLRLFTTDLPSIGDVLAKLIQFPRRYKQNVSRASFTILVLGFSRTKNMAWCWLWSMPIIHDQ